KPTNLVATRHAVRRYVHSHHHHILFNPTIPFHNEPIHQQGSIPTNHNPHTITNILATLLSPFQYKPQKEK
ncbi:DUF1672 family protein, partial [Staphylococcus epidermidis]|uniref:DUF1672 family protein n=1 Tax=Staphylococcus epidermidis TaxID=1282 RepID=UPI0011A5980D